MLEYYIENNMQVNVNQIVTTAVEKAKGNPKFTKDLIKYVQYILLSTCPQDKSSQLNQLVETGNMKDLLEFGTQYTPDFNRIIVKYINSY